MTTLPQIFTARQVVKITGIPYSKLDFWAKSNLIRPSVSDGTGSGSRRLYGPGDLIAIRVAWNLRRNGLSGKSLRKVMDYVRKQNLDAFTVEKLGKDVVVKSPGQNSVSALGRPGQMYLNLTNDLSEAIAHVARELKRPQNSSPYKKIAKSEQLGTEEVAQRKRA